MSEDTANLILAVATENAELRAQLAEAQDLLVKTAVDAGELHACVEDLQTALVAARRIGCSASKSRAAIEIVKPVGMTTTHRILGP